MKSWHNMKPGHMLCLFGRHRLTQWRRGMKTVTGVGTIPHGITTVPVNERRCKRPGCTYRQTKPLRPRRAATSADTVTGNG